VQRCFAMLLHRVSRDCSIELALVCQSAVCIPAAPAS
jgi:hypothetical protein